MRALIFNHHPDYTWQLQKALQELSIECFLATHDLTFKCGADYCSSSSDFKLRTGPRWYTDEELFGQKTFQYKDNYDDIDYIFTMNKDIVNRTNFNGKKVYFSACVRWDLEGMNDCSKYTKITSHHNASKFNAKYLPYFVPQKGELKVKKYVTQLMEGFRNTPYLSELLQLRQTQPVIIAGADDAPDGVVSDWQTLSETSLLVHYKDYGTNCNAVMKALDTGIPVYISRENKEQIGMGDLPDEMFIFSNDFSIKDAFKQSLTIDNNKIQSKFREIRNVKNTSKYLKSIL
jgi:hypothetical protein